MTTQTTPAFTITDVQTAAARLRGVAFETPLQRHDRLSEAYGAHLWLKREDLQVVRSYKIRGAYNKMSTLTDAERAQGVVCASAGNHAQGFAMACRRLGVRGTVFMPAPTPRQKITQVEMFGGDCIRVVLHGDTFDDAQRAAQALGDAEGLTFVPPFDDPRVIEGQATVGLEIMRHAPEPIDYLFLPVGGGGLSAGVGTLFRQMSPATRIIGVEPAGAPAMHTSLARGERVVLDHIDTFVDGAAVRAVGARNFELCRHCLDEVALVPEGRVCQTLLDLYNRDAIVAEPAGALAIAALDDYREQIRGKRVVCVVSGGNNDIDRMAEVKERALLYLGLKHYFIVKFPQRAGALREFVTDVLGPHDDIVHFEYSKKTSRERGPALVGVELRSPEDFEPLVARMKAASFYREYLNDRADLFQYLV
ncbi:MAG: threonine ammonia-lyase IlvA [Catalinimonas sp.]